MRSFLAFLLSLVFLGVPVTALAEPLGQGDQAIAFDFQYSKQADGSETDAFGTYYWYTGATQRTGAAILWSAGDTTGGAVGPSYDLLMGAGDLKVVLGGDVAFLAGDLQDAAQMAIVTRLGFEYTIGDSGTAIRFLPRWVHALNEDAPGTGDAVDEIGFTVGILLGIARPSAGPAPAP